MLPFSEQKFSLPAKRTGRSINRWESENMTTRMKPILGMWIALMVLSFIQTFLRPDVWAGDNAMLGQWPTLAILWLITAVFFDWVIQSTGMAATQIAIVIALGSIIVFGQLAGWLFFSAATGPVVINALQKVIFWYVGAFVYDKLSSEQTPAYE